MILSFQKKKPIHPIIEQHGKEILVLVAGMNIVRSLKDILSLNLVCKSIHQLLIPVMEDLFVFRNPKPLKISTVSPKHIRIRVPEFFSQKISYIPPSTSQIVFSDFFNISLDKYSFPPSVTHLTFGYYFNTFFSSFPPSLTHLTFGHNFNKALVYPNTLKHLVFGNMFQKSVDNLPDSLTYLNFGPNYSRNEQNKKNIQRSCGGFFMYTLDSLPPFLTHLTLCGSFNQPLTSLPPSLLYLILGFSYNQPLTSLPPSLLYLELGYLFRDHSIDSLPPSLSHLLVNEAFRLPILAFPPALTHLTLLAIYEVLNLETTLPNSIKTLVLPKYLQQKYKFLHDKFPNMEIVYTYLPKPPPIPYTKHSYRYHKKHLK